MKLPKKKKKEHVHTAHSFDGFYERCKCGAFSGDKKDELGFRYLSFGEWPKEEEGDNV